MRTARLIAVLAALATVIAPALADRVIPFPHPKPAFDYTKIDRTLVEPKYASGKPAYRFYALGPEGKTIMAMVLDESKGAGKGYDTFYIDLNLNGDLTDKGEKFVGPEPAKTGGYRPTKDRTDLFTISSGKWRNKMVENHLLGVPDKTLNYRLNIYYSFTRFDISTKKDDWKFPMRVMDGGVPWGAVKAKAPVIRVGGPDWRFYNDKFISRPSGLRSPRQFYPCYDKEHPTAKPGDKIWIDGTSSFFAGSSPSVRFEQGAVYSPWTARNFTARVEDTKGNVISHMRFNQSCGGARWATSLITSEYPDGESVMVFDTDTGGHVGRIVQKVPFKVSNPGYGKPLPELDVTRALRKANPEATILEIHQGAKLADLGVPKYDGARDTYFGIYGLGQAHAESCQNVGASISFGHDIRNELHLGGEGRRALLKFDLSMLDKKTTVKQAVLAMNVLTVNTKIDTRTQTLAMKKPWSEALARDAGGLIYRGQGSAGVRFYGDWPIDRMVKWQERMFNGAEDRHADPIAETVITRPGWISFDVTQAAKNWVSGQWANHGLGLAMVADRRKYGGRDIILRSSDFPGDPRVRPCLILVLDGKPKVAAHKVAAVNDGLAEAAAKALAAKKPLLVCALSPDSLTSRALEKRVLANKELQAWVNENFAVARIDAADARHKAFLKAHGVRRCPSLVVMSPDPAQPNNFALVEPLEWDAPNGMFRSSFEFEQVVAKALLTVLQRAKNQNGVYSVPNAAGCHTGGS